jgi:hypothetical protein
LAPRVYDTFQHWGPYLAERGYAGFTVSYRLTSPAEDYPESHDIRAAAVHQEPAKDFKVDPDRIALWKFRSIWRRWWRSPPTVRCSWAAIRRTMRRSHQGEAPDRHLRHL